MTLETQFIPQALRTLPSDSLALLKTVTQRPAGVRMAWVASTYPGTGPIAGWGGTDEPHIRPASTVAFGLAALVATNSNNVAVSGYSDADITTTAVRLISSLANTHKANGGNWGGVPIAVGAIVTPDNSTYHWQGAFWVAQTVAAAKLLWTSLTGPQQAAVTAMAQLEADRFLVYTVPYMRNRYGRVLIGDTKGEENGWNAWILMLCAGLWPDHAHAQRWLSKGLELTLSAAANPLFPTSKWKFHGLSGWVQRAGSNSSIEGTVVNHNVDPHPNYMPSVTNQAWMAGFTCAWLLGRFPAAAQTTGLQRIYRAMMDLPFTGYQFPGPIYDTVGGTATINWPSGTEGFNPLTQQTFMAMDAFAHMTGCDNLASIPAATWLNVHAAQQNTLQVADPTTWCGSWDLFNGAWVLFADWVLRNGSVTVSNKPASELLEGAL